MFRSARPKPIGASRRKEGIKKDPNKGEFVLASLRIIKTVLRRSSPFEGQLLGEKTALFLSQKLKEYSNCRFSK
ncbi:predicted protein [Enterococcus gallinarum EG2]|nr:predicted protein [Enterococcus gallinarum EG2]